MNGTNAFDRWMTFERIARSDLMMLLFECLKERSLSGDEVRELSLAAVSGFADSDCYFLADVVGALTGRQTLGFMDDAGNLVHAVSYDPATGHVADIMGTQPVGSMRLALEQAMESGIAVKRLPSILGEIESARYLMLVEIARGLPWIGVDEAPLPRKLWSGVVLDYVSRYRRQL